MDIVLNRIDERLIHGQVLTSWVKKLRVQKIIVVDDALAENAFVKSVLLMTLPQGITPEVLTVEQAIKQLSHPSWDGTDARSLVLFKEPATAYALVKSGYPIAELNIGCMAAQPKRKKLSNYVYASDREIEMFREMLDMGIDIYLRVVYAEPRIAIADLLNE